MRTMSSPIECVCVCVDGGWGHSTMVHVRSWVRARKSSAASTRSLCNGQDTSKLWCICGARAIRLAVSSFAFSLCPAIHHCPFLVSIRNSLVFSFSIHSFSLVQLHHRSRSRSQSQSIFVLSRSNFLFDASFAFTCRSLGTFFRFS